MADFKVGLDYYSHYIGMTRDSKLRRIRKKYGSVGVDVWLAVLDLIYSDKGYYIPYGNEDEIDDVTWKVVDYVKGKYAPDVTAVEEIIESLVACRLFSGDLFKLGILSSKRIQLQYYASTVERKAVEIIPEFWLVSESEMKKVSERSSILRYFSNRPNIGDNRPICEDNQPITEQSKVKQIKVNKSEVNSPANAAQLAPPTSAPPTTAFPTRESLIEIYGKENVSRYEEKYDKWKAEKGGFVKGDRYKTIRKWMEQDGIQKPVNHSSFDMDKVMENILKQYKKKRE